jgi:hypothetical protein
MARLALLVLVLGACSSKGGGSADGPATAGDGPAPAADAAADVPMKADMPPPITPGVKAPRLTPSTLDVDLGTVAIGSMSTGFIVVTNAGDAASGPLAVMVTAPGDIRSQSNCMGRRLGPDETCVVTLTFLPATVGAKMGTGKINQTEGDPMALAFTVHGIGRLAPDAGPDVPRDVSGLEAGRDGLDSGPEAPRPEPSADGAADRRD